MSRKRSLAIGLVLGLWVWAAASSAWATDYSWNVPTGGAFNSTSSWIPAHVPGSTAPGSTDGAKFNLGAPGYTVTFNTNYWSASASIQNDNVTFSLGSYCYSQTNTTDGLVVGKGPNAIGYLTLSGGALSSASVKLGADQLSSGTVVVNSTAAWSMGSSGSVSIGYAGRGVLAIQGGSVSDTSALTAGDQAGAWGTVTVDGTSASCLVGTSLTLGNYGSGELFVRSGGQASCANAFFGSNAGAYGAATVDGAGSSLAASNVLNVGYSGTGALAITGGGIVSSNTSVVGSSAGSQGSVLVDGAGSVWMARTNSNSPGLVVGGQGSGQVTVSGGGLLTSNGGEIGQNAGASGSVTVRGTGSAWNSNAGLVVGDGGVGYLTVSGGGRVTSGTGSTGIGLQQGSFGSVTVDGAGSSWTSTNAGGLWVGGQGTGLLTITGGGRVTCTTINLYANSTFTLDGGTVSAANMNLNDNGALAMVTDGLLSVTQRLDNRGELRLGGASARITVQTLDNHTLLSGTGRIEGIVQNENGATITVTGSDRLTVAGPNADIRNAGTVNLVSGGTVESLRGISNYSAIAGQGTLSTGAGYHLDNSGSIAFSTGLSNVLGNVLNEGPGSIIVSGGGAATFYGPVTHNGTQFKVSQGSTATFLGLVNGAGNFNGTGTIYFEGGYSPGNSPAAVTFEGNVVLTSNAALQIELGGPAPGVQYDTVSVGHALTLGGTLDVQLVNGFRPKDGDSFQVLSWGTQSGAFNSMTGLALGNRLTLVPVWNTGNLMLRAVQCGSTWAADASGTISLADNWTGGAPGGAGDCAKFGPAIHAPRQVAVNAPTTLGAMIFSSDQAYTVAGPSVLTLQADIGHATIDVSAAGGSVRHVISAPVTLASALDITTAAATTLRFEGALGDAAGLTITKSGDGTFELAGPQTWGTDSLLDVLGGTVDLATDAGTDDFANLSIEVSSATVNFDANQHLDRLIIGDGGTVVLRHAGVVVVNDLQIGGFDFGRMVITPEPATLALMAIGAAICVLRKRRL